LRPFRIEPDRPAARRKRAGDVFARRQQGKFILRLDQAA
jgi:hypothetical protein